MAEHAHTSADHLESRLEFETLISDTSASLFASPPEQLDRAVECALERVRRFFRADRCGLLTVSADQQDVAVHLVSYGEGVPQFAADINPVQEFPWSRRTLLVERTPVRVSRIADLPSDAETERETWIRTPIRSALVVPVETRGIVSHLMFLNTVQHEREWPDAFLTRLRVLGEMLVGALERQEMFAGLREAEERVSLAADSAGEGLWVLDDRTGTFWVSERVRAIFGYRSDEVVDMKRLEASVHPDDWDMVRRGFTRSARFGEPIDLEYRIVTDDGLRWVASRGRSQPKAGGEAMRLTGVTTDISERRRAEEALHTSEARLASAADLAGLAFYEVHFDQGVAYVDHRFRDICGLGRDVAEGLAPLEFWMAHLHPDDRQRVLRTRQTLHERSPPNQVSFEYRYLHPARGERWMHHLARVASRDADGRAISAFGVLRDITEHKRAEAELRDLSQRLIRAHEDQRALLARELHDDLTQRLAVLAIDVGRAELLAKGGAQAETLQAVRDGLARLSEDVHSLAYQLHPSVLDDLGLAEALRAECERVGRQAPVELSVEVDPMPTAVAGDAALCLFRVAQEALSNVIHHAGARAASVVLRHMDGGVLLAVRDDGVGFDPESPSRARSLGLASMRERVQLVNGTLDIESAPGQGTTIVAWVPAAGSTE